MPRARWLLLCLPLLGLTPAVARAECAAVVDALRRLAVDVQCTVSADLTTANPDTTPADNSRPGLPPFAFTPRTDAQAVSPDPPNRTPITRTVPGLQIAGGLVDDPDARWVLRIPDGWTGRLVVGVPGGLRSEFMGDHIFSDFVVQRLDAYVSINKGTLNFQATTAADPLGCRLSPPPHFGAALFFRFYLNDPEDTIREWFARTSAVEALARKALSAHHRRAPRHTYLFGISNGGHVTRRLLASDPGRFDGGVDWEGVYWSRTSTFLVDLPVALRNWADYRDSGLDPDSPGAQAIRAAGFPPDIRATAPAPGNIYSPVLGSFWETHLNNYWDVTTCAFAQEIDPAYEGAPEDYDFTARRAPARLDAEVRHLTTDGTLRRPLITVHGTMDALVPLLTHARPYRAAVMRAGREGRHRLYEVQNGNHVDRFSQSSYNFTQLELVQPHAHRAFELLVDWVEGGVAPPAGQCIPRGAAIVADPAAAGRPEHCAELLVE